MRAIFPPSAVVKVDQLEEDPAIQSYEVDIKDGSPGQACTILAYIFPLQCQINNLALAKP